MSDTTSQIYFTDTKAKAVFAADGPKPQFLIDTPQFKALVVGLEAGGQIPKPGVTVVVPSGVKRGMNAKTRVVFLGSKGES